MNMKFDLTTGKPYPFGATLGKDGKSVNFSIFSRHATRVTLVIELADFSGKAEQTEIEIPPENRTSDIWHIEVKNLPASFVYGYRIDGPTPTVRKGHAFDHNIILLDPYCPTLVPRAWGEPSYYGKRPCCLFQQTEFDWQGVTRPKTPLTETIIYELHVRGFTYGKGANVTSPGTFTALTEKIPYFKELGVTAIELLPVTAFDETDCPFLSPKTKTPLRNYWGYNPLSFFALHPGYAANPAEIIIEFKTMVREFHRAGLEVYLDMVLNHTSEGNYEGQTTSFRGMDNHIFYILDNKNRYQNYTGCGNTLNCNHPVVRVMLYDTAYYWATEMKIDGFRFDLASIFYRGQSGEVLETSPLVERLAEDPMLTDIKLIAEAWDAAGLYQVGEFSKHERWLEWNGQFRDDVRAFMAGHKKTVSKLATRIAGSSDLYQKYDKSPVNSINFITSHDGFTLHDLVSYNSKHNEMNGEQNRDGANNNFSWNSGVEGPTNNSTIKTLRMRRMKSFMTILLLSQGVPMITAGDEFARSQKGNNNAWSQDNTISWLDWNLLRENRELFQFAQKLIALRQRYKIFGREDFFGADLELTSINWQALSPGEENWDDDCQGLAFLLTCQEATARENVFFTMLNGNMEKTLEFTLPSPPGIKGWYLLFHSAENPPKNATLQKSDSNKIDSPTFVLPPFTAVVLQGGTDKMTGFPRKKCNKEKLSS